MRLLQIASVVCGQRNITRGKCDMDRKHDVRQDRRKLLRAAAIAAAGSILGILPWSLRAQEKGVATLKIGVIGSGRIGGTVGELWVKAGHQVMFSSLYLEYDKALAARLGAGARAGTPKEAAAFGEVLLIRHEALIERSISHRRAIQTKTLAALSCLQRIAVC
jgi:hypothetical protein